MITIQLGKPRISVRKPAEEGVETDSCSLGSIFSLQTVITLGAGVAIGVIMKQQSDIHSLKRTIDVLQRGVFYG